MAKTTNKPEVYGGIYEMVEDRVYSTEKTALFGIFRWEQVVHRDRLAEWIEARIESTVHLDRVLVNGVEYVASQKESTKE